MSGKKNPVSRLFEKMKKKNRGPSIGSPSNSQRGSLESGPQPIDTPSRGQRTREAAIILLDFGSIISEATDVLKPMKMVCLFIKRVLEVSKSVDQVDEDWKDLIDRLKFHVLAIQSQTSSLEEDQSMNESPPPLNQDIQKPLQDYISALNIVGEQLNDVYEKWQENGTDGILRMKKVVDVEHNKGVIAQKTRELDEAFQRYTIALEHFVAKKVDQIQRELVQFRLEFKQEVTVAHLDRLKESSVYGNQHRQCLEGTRLKTLRTIHEWADGENTSSRIFCLLDVAGSGKSTVAKHMVKKWDAEKWLVGRFFFSRDTTETMSTRLFCSTVSDAFSSLNNDFKDHASAFKARPDIQHLSFEEQFEGLVANPLRLLNLRVILTIDALDECEDRIKVLETLRDQQSSIPLLRTLVTGRPEYDIKEWAKKVDGIQVTNFRDLEGENEDVNIYVRFRLRDMPDIQDRVMRRAEGLFIWARIACDLLVKSYHRDALMARLEGPLEGEAKLDSIYRIALEQATPSDQPSHQAMISVLQMILAAKRPLSTAELEKISPWNGSEVVQRVVDGLGSLLIYRNREDPIRLLHTTIREFLIAQKRAGVFHIQPERGHYTLALGSLVIIRGQSDSDIDTLDEISQRTFDYASSSWVHHCAMSCSKLALNKQVLEFVNNGLKTWINLLGRQGIRVNESHIRDVLLLSHRNTYPQITEIVLDRTIEQIDEEIPITMKRLRVAREAAAYAGGFAAAEFAGEEFYGERETWKELKKDFEERKEQLKNERDEAGK